MEPDQARRNPTSLPNLVAAIALVAAACAAFLGCSSIDNGTLRRVAYLSQLNEGSALKVRRTPRNPLENELNLLGWMGPKPSERTTQTLRRYGLAETYKSNPMKAYQSLVVSVRSEANLEAMHALSEIAYVQGTKAKAAGRTQEALELFGESIATSYEYLFDQRFDHYRNVFDPEFRRVCDLYNVSLEEILRLMKAEGTLIPGRTGSVPLRDRTLEFDVVMYGRWSSTEIQECRFVSDFEVEGLSNRYHSYGLGVPLIAVRKASTRPSPTEQFYPNGLTFPVTAFFRQLPQTSVDHANGVRRCIIELHDPLDRQDVLIEDRRAPLESDISTPLAYYLNDPTVGTNALATLALLDANFAQEFDGLYMLEPFDPNKIPVVMVHGLWSSPVTWMEMFNDLRSMPEIRSRYQFWFYMYPSGQPFWASARQMRSDLAEAMQILDPQRRSPQLQRMVLVGHSMGGLVSRLQTIDSQDRFWNLVSQRSPEELQGSPEKIAALRDLYFFQPNPNVRRVITIGTPHHGSDFANSAARWVSRKFITLPSMLTQTGDELVQANPGFFRDNDLLTITTSVDSLSSDCPFLPVMLEAPTAPWVHYHNVIGVVPDTSTLAKVGLSWQEEGDGIVPLTSARVPGVDSELIVPAEHMDVHRHPLTILEVRRILIEHLTETPFHHTLSDSRQ